MPEDFIRCMIRAAIELFPIDKEKKEDVLQSIVTQKKTEEEQ